MILHSTRHTANRPHKCATCGKEIKTAETYARARNPKSRNITPVAFHEACYRAATQIAEGE